MLKHSDPQTLNSIVAHYFEEKKTILFLSPLENSKQ